MSGIFLNMIDLQFQLLLLAWKIASHSSWEIRLKLLQIDNLNIAALFNHNYCILFCIKSISVNKFLFKELELMANGNFVTFRNSVITFTSISFLKLKVYMNALISQRIIYRINFIFYDVYRSVN